MYVSRTKKDITMVSKVLNYLILTVTHIKAAKTAKMARTREINAVSQVVTAALLCCSCTLF